MKYEKLFEPVNMGALHLRNRIVLSPMHTNFTVDNKYTERYIEYYKERAKGGVGLIITAHVMAEVEVDPYPATFGYPTLDSASEIKYFAELTEGVHEHGAKIAIELSPGTGRLADEIIPGKPPVGPSEIPLLLAPNIKTKELTKEEIHKLVEYYGRAAGLAKRAGFDALYVHFLAYLGDQFLSSCWNKRQDEYGGSLENRMRFLFECIESARAQVGKDFPMIVGLALDHGFPEGRQLEETIEMVKRLEKLDISAVHLRRGSYDGMNLLIPTAYMEDGISVDYAYEVKKAVNIPVIVDGNLPDAAYCEKILQEGKTDFVGIGRPMITDPYWPNKSKEGKEVEILPCIRCMQCIDRVFFSRYSACSINPEYGREYEGAIPRAVKPKKVLVVGGGPAGMTAAKYLAEKGHDVTLAEKGSKLGGHLLEAAAPACKKGTRGYLEWLIHQVNKMNVKVSLNTEVTPEFVLSFNADAVVVSTGSVPQVPPVSGIDGKNVKIATKLLADFTDDIADHVVVVGAGLVGCETALFLKDKGKSHVTLIDMLPEIAYDVIYMARFSLLGALAEKGIHLRPGLKLKEVTANGIVAEDSNGNVESFEAGTVVIATGLKSDDSLYQKLQGKAKEVYQIGDCITPRKFIDAVHEAYAIAKMI